MLRRKAQTDNTEKTIEELKLSIDSIQKMIEKSQEILRTTRPLQPRQLKSDEIHLKFNSNSKSKSKHKDKHLGKLNQTNATTNDGTTFSSRIMSSLEKVKNKPQKTKPHLQIDTDVINESLQFASTQNILIHQSTSPVSAIGHRGEENFVDSSSFADSLQSHFNLGRRFKTEGINDSWEYHTLDSGSLEKIKQNTKPEKSPKMIILKKKNNNHFRRLSELEEIIGREKPKRKIFDKNIEQGKYSNFHPILNRKEIEKKIKKTKPNYEEQFRLATLSSARQPCMKNLKMNDKMGLQEFNKKVRKYGFVQRYLTQTEISCIYEYLKKSQIPEYKWPLYVVDEVYEKMQTPKNMKF